MTRVSPNHVVFYAAPDCREKVSFTSLLDGEDFSTVVYFKWAKKVFSIRLLGAKLPEEKRAAAEKRVRRRANRNQRKISGDTVTYTQWVFLATTLPYTCSDAEILEAYRFHKLRRSGDQYKNGIVSLWITLSFLISCIQLWILRLTNFSISDFNAFSLAKGFFA